MKQTIFKFTVEFQGDEPNSAHDALLLALRGVAGVEAIETADMTERCPVAKLAIQVRFDGAKQAERLYNKLTRLIDSYKGAHMWSRRCTLTEMYET